MEIVLKSLSKQVMQIFVTFQPALFGCEEKKKLKRSQTIFRSRPQSILLKWEALTGAEIKLMMEGHHIRCCLTPALMRNPSSVLTKLCRNWIFMPRAMRFFFLWKHLLTNLVNLLQDFFENQNCLRGQKAVAESTYHELIFEIHEIVNRAQNLNFKLSVTGRCGL